MGQLPALLIFMALVLVLSLYGLTVSGHFPAEPGSPLLGTRLGGVIVWCTLSISLCVLAVTLYFAWRMVPATAAIIGGGAMVLVAPLLLRPFPDRFVDDRAGLLAFAGLGIAFAMLAVRFID